jgi:hypothetical protein
MQPRCPNYAASLSIEEQFVEVTPLRDDQLLGGARAAHGPAVQMGPWLNNVFLASDSRARLRVYGHKQ